MRPQLVTVRLTRYQGGEKAISNSDMTIQEFLIQAINKGSDDTGKVHMQVEYNGATYYGLLRIPILSLLPWRLSWTPSISL